MPDVIEDLQNGHSVSEARGYTRIQRIFEVTGLTGLSPERLLLEAITDPDIPEVGDAYPVAGVYSKYNRCIVTTRQALPSGCQSARVVVLYTNEPTSVYDQEIGGNQTTPTQDLKQVSVGLVSRQTSVDRDGAPLLVLAPISKQNGAGDRGYIETVTEMVPAGTLVFQRTETSPATQGMREAVGKVNSTVLGPYAIGTLKFTRFEQESEDNGTTWPTVYQFSHLEGGWGYSTRWHYEGSDESPADAAIVTFNLPKEYDFSLLGLDFSDTQTPIT